MRRTVYLSLLILHDLIFNFFHKQSYNIVESRLCCLRLILNFQIFQLFCLSNVFLSFFVTSCGLFCVWTSLWKKQNFLSYYYISVEINSNFLFFLSEPLLCVCSFYLHLFFVVVWCLQSRPLCCFSIFIYLFSILGTKFALFLFLKKEKNVKRPTKRLNKNNNYQKINKTKI